MLVKAKSPYFYGGTLYPKGATFEYDGPPAKALEEVVRPEPEKAPAKPPKGEKQPEPEKA